MRSIRFKSMHTVSAVIIGIFIVLSVLAMANGISVRSLLLDETFFARNLAHFPHGYFYDSAPCAPLFYFGTYALLWIFGQGEWVYRLIPFLGAVSGLLIMTFYIWRRYSYTVAAAAVFLMASSYPLVHFASNAHSYASDFFCSVLLFILTDKLIREYSLRKLIVWIIAALLCMALSFTALFVSVAYLILIFVILLVRKEKKVILHFLAASVPFGLGLIALLYVFSKQASSRGDVTYWLNDFLPGLLPWKAGKWFIANTSDLLGYLFGNYKTSLVGLFLVILGSARTIQQKDIKHLMLCWAPVFVTIAASGFQKWPYGPVRPVLFMLPFFLILIASGLEWIWSFTKGKWDKIVVAAAFLILVVPYSWTFKTAFARAYDSEEAMRSLSELIVKEIQPDDRFLVYYTTRTPFEFYFADYTDRAVYQPWSQRDDQVAMQTFVKSHMESGKGRIWLIFSHSNEVDEKAMLLAAKEICGLKQKFKKPDCTAYLFECVP